MKHMLLANPTRSGFTAELMELTSYGWKPYQNIFVHNNNICQILVKSERKPKKRKAK